MLLLWGTLSNITKKIALGGKAARKRRQKEFKVEGCDGF